MHRPQSWRVLLVPLAIYAAVTVVMFWRCLLLGEAFLPLGQLDYAYPWAAAAKASSRQAWNPLHYDSVAQYWVFRDFATRSIRSGHLPLWNPYQFCGTPFVADNLSAVFYPLNVLHVLLGPDRAAGWSAALHLILAAMFTWALLRRLGASEPAAISGGMVYGFGLWPVSWLHLPPFVATATWLPALCLAFMRLREATTPSRIAIAGFVSGLVLLAGHLQIALYELLASLAFALWLCGTRDANRVRFLISVGAAYVLGACCAAPQLLPTAELLRYAHRGAGATSEGFKAYTGYAAHPANLVTLFLPDFFGNPSSPERPYVGFSRSGAYYNYAEGALYVGLLPLCFVALGLVKFRASAAVRLAAGLASAALLVGFGTPVAGILYFGVPGFSGSGSPGRIFIVWTFAASILSAFGLDAVLQGGAAVVRRATPWIGLGAVAAVGCAVAAAASLRVLGAVPLATSELMQQGALLLLSLLATGALVSPRRRRIGTAFVVVVIAVDLVAHGASYNGTGDAAKVRAAMRALETVAHMVGHDRIASINRNWSFAGPESVLPPNLATLMGLRDVQGYDSLFPGQYKLWLRDTLGLDPSPPEVGNMVFVKAPDMSLLQAAGVRTVLSLSELALPRAAEQPSNGVYVYRLDGRGGRAAAVTTDGRPGRVRWLQDDPCRVRLEVSMPAAGRLRLADQYWPGWQAYGRDGRVVIERSDHVFRQVDVPAGTSTVEFRYEPASVLVGVYALCAGLAVAMALALASRRAT